MANTFTLISKSILSSSQSSVSFTGLGSYSSDYTDLQLICTARNTGSGGHTGAAQLLLNSTSPSVIRLYGSGSGVGTDTYAPDGSGLVVESTMTANTFASSTYYLPNFSSSNKKAVSIDSVQENNASTAYSQLALNLFDVTTGVTTLTIQPNGGAFEVGSSFYLYGIKNS